MVAEWAHKADGEVLQSEDNWLVFGLVSLLQQVGATELLLH